MKHLRLFGILIIATHCLVAVWHLLLAPAVLPDMAHFALATPIALIVAAHLVVSPAWWLLPQRPASVLLLALFGVALAFGSYEHFLGALPNNIFHLSAGAGVVAFRISSVLLFFLELSAWVLVLYSVRFLRSTVQAF